MSQVAALPDAVGQPNPNDWIEGAAADSAVIQPVPQVSRNSRASFLTGLVTVDDAMIALINLEHLLSEQSEMDALAPA